MRNNTLKVITLAIVGSAALGTMGVVAACGSSTTKANQPFLDAGQTGKVDMTNAVTIAMPDGFNNVAIKCIGHNSLAVTYHGDGSYGSIFELANDPNCATGVYIDTAAH